MKIFSILLLQLLSSAIAYAGRDAWDAHQDNWTRMMSLAYREDTLKIDSMLKRGININEKNSEEWTALKVAIKKLNPKTVAFLLRKGADPNIADNQGWTPIMEACMNNSLAMVKALLEHHADPNKALSTGWTALMGQAALNDGNTDIMEIMIQYGANVNARRRVDDFSVLRFAEFIGDQKRIALLKKHGAKI